MGVSAVGSKFALVVRFCSYRRFSFDIIDQRQDRAYHPTPNKVSDRHVVGDLSLFFPIQRHQAYALLSKRKSEPHRVQCSIICRNLKETTLESSGV